MTARWTLPHDIEPTTVADAAAAADGTLHLLIRDSGGLELLSYSSDGKSCARSPIVRRWARASHYAGVSLHACTAAAGGGLLCHVPGTPEIVHVAPSEEVRVCHVPGTRAIVHVAPTPDVVGAA